MTRSDVPPVDGNNEPTTGADAPARAEASEHAGVAASVAAGLADVTAGVAELVRAAVRDELDGILPHVLGAIKRDRAFDELSDRLSKAERQLQARRERPLAVAVHRLLNRLRHLDFDNTVQESLAAELIKILNEAGFNETGRAGEEYDPACHDALGGRVVDGKGTITEVHASGLSSFGDIIVRAQVRVAPQADAWPPVDAVVDRGSAIESGN